MSDNKQAIAQVLAFLAALYPRFELTTATIKAYTQILEDIPAELLQAAAKDLGSRSTFFPAAAEIRQAAFDLREQAEGLPTAFDAWAEVLRLMSEYGVRRLPEFSHPVIKQAVEGIGGWRYIGLSENAAADRARFVQAYEEYAKRHRTDVRTLPQIGAYVHGRLASGNDENKAAALLSNVTNKMRNGNG